MFLSNRAKFYLTLIIFLYFCGSCGWPASGVIANRPVASESEFQLPFSTAEPEKFVAELVISTGDLQRVVKIARNGSSRRYDYDYGTPRQVSLIVTSGKRSSTLPSRKVFTETVVGENQEPADDPLSLDLLRRKTPAEFQEIETTNNITKYSVTAEGVEKAKTFIYVDRSLKMPVREEFYTTENEKDVLSYSTEIRNFQTDVDDHLFTVPADFRKVSQAEFQTILRKIKE